MFWNLRDLNRPYPTSQKTSLTGIPNFSYSFFLVPQLPIQLKKNPALLHLLIVSLVCVIFFTSLISTSFCLINGIPRFIWTFITKLS